MLEFSFKVCMVKNVVNCTADIIKTENWTLMGMATDKTYNNTWHSHQQIRRCPHIIEQHKIGLMTGGQHIF